MDEFRYFCKYRDAERTLCQVELWTLTGGEPTLPRFSLSMPLPMRRCTFVHTGLACFGQGRDLDEALAVLAKQNIVDQDFKCHCLDFTGTVDYTCRRAVEHRMGQIIEGKPDIHAPRRVYGLWVEEDAVRVGVRIDPDNTWRGRTRKPRSYSIALPVSLARVALNLAAMHGPRLVDPCCGVGTAAVEAYAMGLTLDASDINPAVVEHANENLAHLGYPPRARALDIAHYPEGYDAAVVDLPYGHFSAGSPEQRVMILRHARRIAGTVVAVLMPDGLPELAQAGLRVLHRVEAPKSGVFSRLICVCK